MEAITNHERLTARAAPRTQNFGIKIKVRGILQARPTRSAFARTLIFPMLARLLKSSWRIKLITRKGILIRSISPENANFSPKKPTARYRANIKKYTLVQIAKTLKYVRKKVYKL